MKICVLASGSKGNSTLIETKNNKILIDIGTTNIYVEKKLRLLNIDPDNIDSIFITHTHVDHVSGLKVFLKKHHPKVYLTKKMYDELSVNIDINNYVIIEDKIILNDLIVDYFKTSHDTNDSLGYVFTDNTSSLVYVTDTGYINVKNFDKLTNKNVYIFESNHDIDLLMKNDKYPYHTKQRILGDKGHLSNIQSAEYLKKLIGKDTKHIVLAHLSQENNTYDLALNTMREKLDKTIDIKIALQNEMSEVIEI